MSIIKDQVNSHLLVQSMFKTALPPRVIDAHKGIFGNVAIIGGESGMVGALLLAARAALLIGAGRTYAAALSKDAPTVDLMQPEIMLREPEILASLSQLDCLVIGPGLGQSNQALELLDYWLKQNVPILLDADALNLIATHPHLAILAKSREVATIITPHVGEAARLLACSTDEIQKNRTQAAIRLAQMLKASCVLKGAGSVCASHDGSWFVNTTGNPGLASGGTGDVLSGMIGGLVAQGLDGFEALKLGVYLHGAAADALVSKGIGPVGMTASEVAHEARNIINHLNAS
ncbi:MAG: NAD(P)H-hydrate dehydratase [Methylotenera sp.]|nr:NAD(P)H-hydrate dehydratase [Methylotenera sp.]